MENAGEEPFGHHVADHLVPVRGAQPLGVSRHALAEGRILVFDLIERGERPSGGKHRPIERILKRNRNFLFCGDGSKGDGILGGAVIGQHAENALVFQRRRGYRFDGSRRG